MKSKFVLAVLVLGSNIAFANRCPDLAGSYTCIYPDSSIYQLKISQKNVENDITIYSFLYPEISNTPENVRASDQGESDVMGWMVACAQNKLIAVTLDGARMHEYYIDSNGNYVSAAYGAKPAHCYPTN